MGKPRLMKVLFDPGCAPQEGSAGSMAQMQIITDDTSDEKGFSSQLYSNFFFEVTRSGPISMPALAHSLSTLYERLVRFGWLHPPALCCPCDTSLVS
jgi:hypothetical protein